MGWKNGSFFIYFCNALNPMSKNMLDTAAGGTIMGRPITEAKRLLDEMQENHAQWHVERSTTKKVYSIFEDKNEELTAKIDQLIGIIKGKEEVNVNAITEVDTDVNFIAPSNYNPNWKNQNYASNYPKPLYPTNQGASNNYGASTGNRSSLEETPNTFMTAQTEQNKTFTDVLKSHDNLLGQLTTKIAGLPNDVQASQERTRSMETHVAKITENQTVTLAKFAGKPEPNPVKSVKMMRSSEDTTEELDRSHIPEHIFNRRLREDDEFKGTTTRGK